MTAVDYLRAIRRRWLVVVATFLVAVGAAWFVTTGDRPARPPSSLHQANVTLLSTRTATTGVTSQVPGPDITNLSTIAALVTLGEVPERVAKAIGADDPRELASNVVAKPESELGFLTITARHERASEARRLAETFARELQGYLEDRVADRIQEERTSLDERMGAVRDELAKLDRRIDGADASERSALSSQRAATVQSLQQLLDRRQSLVGVEPDSGLEIIARSAPEPVSEATLQAPRGRRSQLVVVAALGLLLGIALALIIDRFDVRIRDKRAAETHFDLPVLAEIPALSSRMARAPIFTTAPRSPQANAFRLLATGVAPGDRSRTGDGQAGETGERSGKVILVTSAGPREGKSTVVANLAAALAEAHKTVTVVSCDFRRPSVHRLLGVDNDHGLSDGLASDVDPVLNGHVHPSAIPEIGVVPSGSSVERPGELLSSERMSKAIAEARRISDVVLLDCGPIFTAGESAHLLQRVDSVLLVARAGKTNPVVAERASELLKRLSAPVAGVALTFANEAVARDRWYSR